MSDPSGPFAYIFIPADDSKPVETRTGDKSGGLSDDFLSKSAKKYFYDSSDKGARAAALDNATPEQRKQLAKQLRDEAAASGQGYGSQLAALDDDALVNIMRTTHTSATIEITALTVPTPSNNHRAVSLYTADDARTQNLPYNRRATELLVGCGHAIPQATEVGGAVGICGDAFVGRCHDDENGDVWERVDFAPEDADPKAAWCGLARAQGGGGGSPGIGGARSLSGIMNHASPGGAMGGGGMPEGKAENYTWSQTEDEVEIRIAVASGTKAKYVKVNFGRCSLKVTIAGSTVVHGELGGNITMDESTYTIEDASSGGGKELCVTLGKSGEHVAWPFAVRASETRII